MKIVIDQTREIFLFFFSYIIQRWLAFRNALCTKYFQGKVHVNHEAKITKYLKTFASCISVQNPKQVISQNIYFPNIFGRNFKASVLLDGNNFALTPSRLLVCNQRSYKVSFNFPRVFQGRTHSVTWKPRRRNSGRGIPIFPKDAGRNSSWWCSSKRVGCNPFVVVFCFRSILMLSLSFSSCQVINSLRYYIRDI